MAGRVAYYGGIVKDGLVLDLDAAKRDSYPTTGTTWRDISGNQNNGTLVNGPTFNSDNGGSIVFDGVDDFTSGDISNTGFTSFSLTAWVYTSAISVGDSPISTNGVGSQGTINFIQIGGSPFPWQFNTAFDRNVRPTLNVWTYLCGIQDSTTQQLYVNGVLVASATSTFSTIGSQYTVGVRFDKASSTYFNGRIAQTSVYNKALTATEVLQNYNATKGRYGL